MWNMVYLITGFIFILLLIAIFYSKKKINSNEIKLFKLIMFSNLIGYIIEIPLQLLIRTVGLENSLIDILCRLYMISITINYTIFTIYVFIICLNKQNPLYSKKISKISIIMRLIEIAVICLLLVTPFEKYYDSSKMYIYGSALDLLKLCIVCHIGVYCVLLIKNFKALKDKKYLPIYLIIILLIFMTVLNTVDPSILITNMIVTFICYTMYFTIENPDMKLLEEVHKSKEISDNANEEKTLFLYNMTQEIRNTTNVINSDANDILDSDSIDENKDSARDIIATTSKFTSMTNDILDVSQMDSSNIKVYNSKYNVKNLFRQIVNVYNDICNNKNLEFITNIDHDIPEVLYGDSIGLKDVLNTILSNSTKYTNKGFVEFSVNTIVKNDICRLIMTIEDSGTGIKSEDIRKIKIDNKSLAKANKLITLMNGTMLISSDYGMGTKVKIILDQKIELSENTEISKYESIFDDVTILCVDDSEAGLKIIDKVLKGTKINIDKAETGKECLDKLKINKYDLILLDEELSQISGLDLMKKIKGIRNFDIPVIILTKNNSYEYNEEYMKLGFSDYLLKPIKKELLIDKINKYMKKDKK